MTELQRYQPPPRLLGTFIAALLILSLWLTRRYETNAGVQSANHILSLFIMVLCLVLVWRTSRLFQKHVWNDPGALALFAVPLAYLAVDFLILMFGAESGFAGNTAVVIVLTLLSYPVFFFAYFLYLSLRLPKSSGVGRLPFILLAPAALFVVLRLCDKMLFPLLVRNGVSVPAFAWAISSRYSYFAVAAYVLAAACFWLAGRIMNTSERSGEGQKNE
ncbi:MAG: hypothetical protein IK104_03620 [Clostridia bacterium]|nr:hypothetical protein [Clostridia bacterium]